MGGRAVPRTPSALDSRPPASRKPHRWRLRTSCCEPPQQPLPPVAAGALSASPESDRNFCRKASPSPSWPPEAARHLIAALLASGPRRELSCRVGARGATNGATNSAMACACAGLQEKGGGWHQLAPQNLAPSLAVQAVQHPESWGALRAKLGFECPRIAKAAIPGWFRTSRGLAALRTCQHSNLAGTPLHGSWSSYLSNPPGVMAAQLPRCSAGVRVARQARALAAGRAGAAHPSAPSSSGRDTNQQQQAVAAAALPQRPCRLTAWRASGRGAACRAGRGPVGIFSTGDIVEVEELKGIRVSALFQLVPDLLFAGRAGRAARAAELYGTGEARAECGGGGGQGLPNPREPREGEQQASPVQVVPDANNVGL